MNGQLPQPTRHIGIVACSAEGAALCYRTICSEAAAFMGPHAHPELSLHSLSLADYVRCLDQGDLPGVAALMLDSARKLASAGAELLICPDNTIHQALPWVLPHSPRPWLHIAEVVAAEAQARGFRRLGLLGTRWLVQSEVYPAALAASGIEWLRPDEQERDALSALIMDELVQGQLHATTIRRFQQQIERFKQAGCDAVVLGCTEIPLIIGDHNAALPTLDSTRLLAKAALRAALQAGD